jgi:hypothetical protein
MSARVCKGSAAPLMLGARCSDCGRSFGELVEGDPAPSHEATAFGTPVVDAPYIDFSCSYCERTATHVGAGQDGDFYCPDHTGKAPGRVIEIELDA